MHSPRFNDYAFSYGKIVPGNGYKIAKFYTLIIARIVVQRLKNRIKAYCLGIKNYHVMITNLGRDRYAV